MQSVPFDGNQTALAHHPAQGRLHRRSAAVARRHAEALAVPGRARAHLRQAQLVAVGGDRRRSTFRVRSWPSRWASLRRPASHLERRLGPLDAAAIVISNVIGGGIFFVPVIVAQLVPNPTAMLGVWLAGGALAFAGAMAYAELAAVRPHAGGEYVYLRDAYGPLAAFLFQIIDGANFFLSSLTFFWSDIFFFPSRNIIRS